MKFERIVFEKIQSERSWRMHYTNNESSPYTFNFNFLKDEDLNKKIVFYIFFLFLNVE